MGLAALAGVASGARADVPPNYGHNFVSIRTTVTEGWSRPPAAQFARDLRGRGVGTYEFRIDRTETTASQWIQFLNTFTTQSDALQLEFRSRGLIGNSFGFVSDLNYFGPGDRYALNPERPRAGDMPIYGLSWTGAAYYCNWLHHDRTSDWATIQSGAYDLRVLPNAIPVQQPGARYFLPTLDQWLVSAHYDPNRSGTSQGGWWNFPGRSDVPLVPGFPGQGQSQTSNGAPFVLLEDYAIPVGSYPGVVSPWGLLDSSGGVDEFLGNWQTDGISWYAYAGGTSVFSPSSDDPSIAFHAQDFGGFRIASVIPSPSTAMFIAFTFGLYPFHVRRRNRS
ncbi:MAG: formylglycine-generating enzyme family protein [Phycisphaerales bacterium]|nr:formylglycine-generating enzyme family protein [Phycisphaerales bacterium]